MNGIRQIVVVSDLHCGCQLGLCPPSDQYHVPLDGGGWYNPSVLQQKVWEWWELFWREWVPHNTRGEPFAIVINGDTLDGVHHGSNTQITHNIADQISIAAACLTPFITAAEVVYVVRGTEAHVGPSAQNEEILAERIGAKRTAEGRYSRDELRLRVNNALVDIQHHISPVNSTAFETTALQKEYVIACEEAGKWGVELPDVIVRSHRHRLAKTEVPAEKGSGIAITTPGWQLRTPYAFRLAGARQSMPQFGGILVRDGADFIYTKHQVWSIERTPIEIAGA